MEHDVSELLKDYEQQLHSSSSKHSSSSMVLIRHSPPHDSTVFPPTDHENLHISSSSLTSSELTSPSSQSSSWSQLDQIEIDPDPFSGSDSHMRDPVRDSGWFGIGLEILRSRAVDIVFKFRDYAVFRCPFWSFQSTAGVVTAFVVLLSLWKWVRRRRVRDDGMEQLMFFLKERDKKIIQLLQQIAKTNELLLARDRGMPK